MLINVFLPGGIRGYVLRILHVLQKWSVLYSLLHYKLAYNAWCLNNHPQAWKHLSSRFRTPSHDAASKRVITRKENVFIPWLVVKRASLYFGRRHLGLSRGLWIPIQVIIFLCRETDLQSKLQWVTAVTRKRKCPAPAYGNWTGVSAPTSPALDYPFSSAIVS